MASHIFRAIAKLQTVFVGVHEFTRQKNLASQWIMHTHFNPPENSSERILSTQHFSGDHESSPQCVTCTFLYVAFGTNHSTATPADDHHLNNTTASASDNHFNNNTTTTATNHNHNTSA